MRFTTGLWAVLWFVFSGAPSGQAADLSAGELHLHLDAAARVTGITVGSTKLAVRPGPLVALCDVADGEFRAPSSADGQPASGMLLRFSEAKATVTISARSEGGALRFACCVKGDDLPPRGLLLRLALPFDAAGWRWHTDTQTSTLIDPTKRHENVAPLRAWADLPEWKDQPDLRMGYSNRNFCTVLTGPVGLCLAVPIDRPCIHRTSYHGKAKRLELVYDFALSPDTAKANQADFAFDLYACDPDWGFRSGLARYYQLYPKLFQNLIKEPGQWMAFSRLSEIDNVNEFCFGLQEGAAEPAYDEKLGVLSTTYFTHAGMGARIPNHDPEKDPLPAHSVLVKAMEAAFKQRTRSEGVYHKVGLYNAEGRLDVRKWSVYAHLIAQFNLDPDLEYGRWTLKRALSHSQRVLEKQGATLDGFYYDGLSAGVNYRAEHFKTAAAPCLWDPKAKKPLINNFFSSCEFARAAAELLRPRGQITMMNGALGASFYVVPWLDVLGAETGVKISRQRLNYIRAATYHKPFLTLLKGNFEKKLGHREVELHVQQCLAYGVIPGFFDWMPSGLGPGGKYWSHPRYYERDRDLFRKYLPLCRSLASAGWEPVTHARSSRPEVFLERFGPTAEGVVWFSLLDEGAPSGKTRLSIQAKELSLDPRDVKASYALTGKPIALSGDGPELAAEVDVPVGGVTVVQLAAPRAASCYRIRQALKTLDRGILMRKLDRSKPPLAVHWKPGGKTYLRESSAAGSHLVFAADGKASRSAGQWVMLFQPLPSQLTLRARAAAENLSGRKGTIGIRCRMAWVTPSYSHYETHFYDLPTGTYDWKDIGFDIQVPHALRAIELTVLADRSAKGKLRLAEVSLGDSRRKEYIADPRFKEWYEPIPAELRQPLDEGCRAIRGALVRLESFTKREGRPSKETVSDILDRSAKLRQLINKRQAQNGCRRVLRDLETIRQQLKCLGT